MENKINAKLEKHQLAFKEAIKEWMSVNKVTVMASAAAGAGASAAASSAAGASAAAAGQIDKTNDFLQFIYDYSKMEINKSDFQKRTRVKNVVPFCDLCVAKVSAGLQCTRRKQNEDSLFCGTHIKGQPYGIETKQDKTKQQMKKIEIWVQEIKGINYYIDSSNNVYKPEDIIANLPNPAIIAKWALNESSNYVIPTYL